MVTVGRSEDGTITCLTVEGHADYAPRGRDIVCAAVSALAQTAVLGLERAGLKPRVEVREGWLKCAPPSVMTPDQAVRARIIMDTIHAGLEDIAAGYPEHVALREETVRGE